MHHRGPVVLTAELERAIICLGIRSLTSRIKKLDGK